MYYRGAAAAIVVFSVTDKVRCGFVLHLSVSVVIACCHGCAQESFAGAKGWIKELMRRGDPNVIIALAGNKSDLAHLRTVSREVCCAVRILVSWLFGSY